MNATEKLIVRYQLLMMSKSKGIISNPSFSKQFFNSLQGSQGTFKNLLPQQILCLISCVLHRSHEAKSILFSTKDKQAHYLNSVTCPWW